jgi:hypothetical protein
MTCYFAVNQCSPVGAYQFHNVSVSSIEVNRDVIVIGGARIRFYTSRANARPVGLHRFAPG